MSNCLGVIVGGKLPTMSASDVMSATASDTGDIGASFYFAPESLAKGSDAGLDGLRLYLLGRGGVMGDVNAAVAQSSFGYFNPEMITKMWDSGIKTMSAHDVAELYWECAAEHGRGKFGDVAGLAEYCAAAEAVIDAADRDGLPLFAGAASMSLVDDLPGRAYQLAVVLRELRGSAHLAAVRSAGVVPREAHAYKRPEMVEMFGWKDVTVSDDTEAKMVIAEELTDTALAACYSVLDEAGESAFIAGTKAMAAACAA